MHTIDPDLVTLTAGVGRLRIAPAIGGTIVDWVVGAIPVLRPPSPGALAAGNPRLLGSYPLLPYQNRIANGRFDWNGRTYDLPHNFGDKPYAIHGAGWQSTWTVAAATADCAILSLDHDPANQKGWPFRFRAIQEFRLGASDLELIISVENTDREPWPAGLGHHPYFPRTPATTLQFDAEAVWLSGADEMPSKRVPLPPDWDCRATRAVSSLLVDNCFEGWLQPARIVWPEHARALDISTDPIFGHLIVFVPDGRDYFCVEPVTHMSNAIHWMARNSDHGLRVLQPGETLQGAIRFSVQPLV